MSNHILPIKTYVAVFIALMVLLAATVAINRVSLGELNIVAALSIAVVKTFLVVLFFMHVRYSHRLIWIFVGVGFYWLTILLALSMTDFLSRTWPPLGR